jgi:hypothetical protein
MAAPKLARLLVGASVLISACSEQKFAAGNRSTGATRPAPVTPEPTSNQVPEKPIVPAIDEPKKPNEIVKCSEGRVSYITTASPAGERCPENSTPFAADDGSNLNMACCALPNTDILLATAAPVTSGSVCPDDSLIVGSQGNVVICQKIDTTKYKLVAHAKACYYGKGASGSSGAGACGAPNKMLSALQGRFGSDGCVAAPGSVVHGRSGKNCGDIDTMQLQTISGAPVAFPY